MTNSSKLLSLLAVGVAASSCGKGAITDGMKQPPVDGPVNVRPVISAVTAAPATIGPRDTVTLTATASDADADTLRYQWVAPTGWSSAGAASNTASAMFVAPDVTGVTGEFAVIVFDGRGGTAQGKALVTVSANQPPAISAVTASPQTVAPRGQTTLAVTATDAEGDALSYAWNLPAGWRHIGVNTQPTLTAVAPSLWATTGTATITVTDARGGQSVGQVTLSTQANGGPTIATVTATPNQVGKLGLITLTAQASDPDNDTLRYEWQVPAGWLLRGTNNGASATVMAPNALGAQGTVTILVTDSAGTSATGSVVVSTSPNHAPVIASLTAAPQTIAKGASTLLTASASDADAEPISYAWSAPVGWVVTASGVGNTATATAPATGTSSGLIELTARDSSGASTVASVTVTVSTNTAPAIADVTGIQASVLPNQTLSLSATVTDADADAVTVTWSSSNQDWLITGTGATVTVTAPRTAQSTTELTLTATDANGTVTKKTFIVAAAGCSAGTMNCDGNPDNGCEKRIDTETDCGSCGSACTGNQYCNRTTQRTACTATGISCEQIRFDGNSTGDGYYWVQPTTASTPLRVYCDMTTDTGGWTVFYAGKNGQANASATEALELTTSTCSDPGFACVRRAPATFPLWGEVLASCGNEAIKFKATNSVRNYLVNGTQSAWQPTLGATALTPNATAQMGTAFYTGSGASRGWILAGSSSTTPALKFASGFNGDATWDYCAGLPNASNPIRLAYRNRVTGFMMNGPYATQPGAVTIVVRAVDATGNNVSDYRGTVELSTTGTGATLPAPYTYTESDQGSHSFALTLPQVGHYDIVFRDTAHQLTSQQRIIISNGLGTNANPALSCAEIVLKGDSQGDGVYFIRPFGASTPAPMLCDMTTDRGGWTTLFIGPGGQANAFVGFDNNVLCSDPSVLCARRAAASISPTTEFMVQCGEAKMAYSMNPQIRNFFVNGTQSSWLAAGNYRNLAATTSLSAGWMWSGSGGNTGFIFSGSTGATDRTFANVYSSNTSWDFCNLSPLRPGFAPVVQIKYRDLPATFTIDAPRVVTDAQTVPVVVKVVDATGAVVPNYRGTVHFESTDGAATLPADYTFVAADNGVRTFNALAFPTTGRHTLTVRDTTVAALTGSSDLQVSSALGSIANPASSCLDILTGAPSAASGVYRLTDGTTPYNAYCDMKTAGGGWTLVLKIDGASTNFVYSSALWTNATLLNPDSVFDDYVETKGRAFIAMPFTNMLLKMQSPIGGPTRSMVLPVGSTSALALFSGPQVLTNEGRSAWKALFGPSASMQVNCNREGININAGEAARIGIVGNNENDCSSNDSRMAIGGAGGSCGTDNNMSIGVTTRCGGDLGDVDIRGFASVWVR